MATQTVRFSAPHLGFGLALLLTGCGLGEPTLVAVRGTVTYLGQPVRTGVIVFTPDAERGNRGPVGHAEIRPDGSFTLTTGEKDGAVPGWHRVTVVAVSPPGPAYAGQGYLTPRNLLPDKYRSPDHSGLAREVKAGGENTFAIDLH